MGADAATGAIVVFFDAHVRPLPGWAEPILRHINANYKRVVVPKILGLDGETWQVERHFEGVKTAFDWALDFKWFDDDNDLVPCMSGGLLAMSREWWVESGRLDEGMLQWGGENIEQSVRVWCCGGEIVVARDSEVAHVFRNHSPYKVSSELFLMNRVRAAELWFDDYKEELYQQVPDARRLSAGISAEDRAAREELKRRLKCHPFQWYVDKFAQVFRDRGMLDTDTFVLRLAHAARGGEELCVVPAGTADSKPQAEGGASEAVSERLVAAPCLANAHSQRWLWKRTGGGDGGGGGKGGGGGG
eukprot:3312853-Rhodomonas_salina.1